MLTLAGCDEIGSALDDDDDTFHIRSLNLIEDSPAISLLLGDTTVSSLAYGSASSFSAAHPGTNDVSLKAVLPVTFDADDDDDDPVEVRPRAPQWFAKDTPYTVIAYGQLANPQLFFVEGGYQRDEVADNDIVLQFAHAAPDAAPLEVYVSVPQAGIAAPQYVATLNLTESTAPLGLPLAADADDLDTDTRSAEVVIQLRSVGSGQIVFESDQITVAEQNRLLFAIADSNSPGPATVKIVSLSGGQYLDRNDRAALRFVHVSHDTEALDVSATPGAVTPLAQNVAFRGLSGHIDVPAGEVGLIAVPSGNPGAFVFLEEFSASAGLTYSAYAIGSRAQVDAVMFSDEARSVPTQASFRFLHAAGSLENDEALDIYLRLPGEAVDFADDDTTPTFASVAYQTATSYLTYKQDNFEVYFVRAGTSTVILGPVPFQTVNGSVSTFVLLDTASGERELMPVEDVRP